MPTKHRNRPSGPFFAKFPLISLLSGNLQSEIGSIAGLPGRAAILSFRGLRRGPRDQVTREVRLIAMKRGKDHNKNFGEPHATEE
jgi:hypothetical protein